MKRGPIFVLAGTLAGFAGILSFHGTPATPTALAHPSGFSRTRHNGGQRQSDGRNSPKGVRSATGATEQYGFGELAVRVTVSGNRITNVTVPDIQTAEQYSQQLASQVIPTLRSEVLAGQTAGINAVSGATYTSQAYALSVQAALDKLHIG